MRFVIILLILLILPVVLFAQEFQFVREWDSVQVVIDGYTLPAPWTGGYVVTRPAFCDLDGDGDEDLFLGHSKGTIVHYENTGGNNFVLADTMWLGIDIGLYSSPTFQDFDQDGDFDLSISGSAPYGMISLYENIGNSTTPEYVLAVDMLRDNTGAVIDIVDGSWADIDGDGALDYFAGDWDYGSISYYHNEGNGWNDSLRLVTTDLLGSGVGGWPTPRFCDIDADGDLDLFIGNDDGYIWYYRNDGDSVNYDFTYVTSYWQNIDVGDCASPEFADMDGDGDYDLWVGRDMSGVGSDNIPGDVFYYENTGTPQVPRFQLVRTSNLTLDVGYTNTTVLCDFDADNSIDLLISNNNYLIYYQNRGTVTQPCYELVSEDYLDFLPYDFDLYDLDADGDLDLVSAHTLLFDADIYFYENIGSPQVPQFSYVRTIETPYDALGSVTLADIDADGDGDMLMYAFPDYLLFFENQGTPEAPDFVLESEHWQNVLAGNPRFADIDLDGDFDLLIAVNMWGTAELWENIGTPQNAQMVLADSDLYDMTINGPRPFAADVDADGDMDLLVGSVDGGVYFLRNVTGEPPSVPPQGETPSHEPFLFLGPNPANPVTWITCQLPYPQEAELAVYNLLGRKVAVLASGFMLTGKHTFTWNAGDYPSGAYWIRLKSDQLDAVRKVVVVK